MTKRKAKLDKDLALLEEMGVTQYNRTDPDAKLMIKPAHNLMAYNVQIAVDKKYKFIVVTDVSSDRNDVKQLPSIASECKEVLGKDKLKIAADTGYYSAVNIKACMDKNITVFVPAQKNKKQNKKGLF